MRPGLPVIALFALVLVVVLAGHANEETKRAEDITCKKQEGGIFQNVIEGSSIIDDCCCRVDTVQASNAKNLRPLLNELVSKRFFRYFKLDLYSDCPFWVADFLCASGGCGVCECNEDEVPTFWNQQSKQTDFVEVQTPGPNSFSSWEDVEENMWIVQQCHEEEMSYVNLGMYPEGNTEYDGRMIWDRIYDENCFKGSLDSMCLEERVFYRLISGLHASINIHICKHWQGQADEEGRWVFNENLDLYRERIAEHPERIKNLYFAFLFLLRSVSKAGPILKEYSYDTGRNLEQQLESDEIRRLIGELLNVDLLCSPNFDESTVFADPQKESIKQQFKQHFRNISLIMNCVTCEKCRVYAKLQTLGVGTALKILFSDDVGAVIRQLQRNEIIALVNTLRQLSTSIDAVEWFSQEIQRSSQFNILSWLSELFRQYGRAIFLFVAVFAISLMTQARKRRQQRHKQLAMANLKLHSNGISNKKRN